MNKGMLDTEIDELLDLIYRKGTVSMPEATKIMHVDEKVMKSWVDFLVEDKVVVLDYNFFTPILKLTDQARQTISQKIGQAIEKQKEMQKKRLGIKGEFFKKAQERGFEKEKIKYLWNLFVTINENKFKKEFYDKASQRGIDSDLEGIWKNFLVQYKAA